MTWKIEIVSKPDLKNSILVAGLPGIGNVGKIVTDFLVEELKAEKVCEFFSYHMPHSVYIKEDNTIAMPKIELYFKQMNAIKLLILTGDSQPVDEEGCYSFCDAILDFFQQNECSEVITLGGIGLNEIPKIPKVYCSGNNKEIIDKYVKDTDVKIDIYGVVGPIMGVSGLLLGMAGKRKIGALCYLAETLGHPMFLGLKSAREILKVLDKRFSLNINLKNLDKEIKEIEPRMKITDELSQMTRKSKKDREEVSYIG